MKSIRTVLLASLVVAVVSLARAQEKSSTNSALAELQGEWSMVSGIADGYHLPPEMLANSRRVCKGDELTATIAGQLVMKAKITVDASRKPKTIDYQVLEGPTKGSKHLGIYEVEGDTMKSCFGAPGAERPADYTSKQGDMRTSTVWKRDKPAAPVAPK